MKILGCVSTIALYAICPLVATSVYADDAGCVLTGPYGIRIEAAPGCEKGAKYVLGRLKSAYLPKAVRYYGDPFAGETPTRVFTFKVKRNDGTDKRGYTGPSWGSCSDGLNQFTIGLSKGSDKWEMDLTLAASKALTICQEENSSTFTIYVNRFVEGAVNGKNPTRELKEQIKQGLLPPEKCASKDRRIDLWRKFAPMWSVFEELRERHPTFVLDYCNLKNERFTKGELKQKFSDDEMVALLSEATGEDVRALCKKYGVKNLQDKVAPVKNKGEALAGNASVVQKIQSFEFLLNNNFKQNAKIYLCLFSASWCPPCRAEMPRIAKIYNELIEKDPDIELIHFSRDRDVAKATDWAQKIGVRFPVIKSSDKNLLGLSPRGIPHLYVVRADGTVIEEGHPMKLFTEEKLRELKSVNSSGEVKPKVSDGEASETVGEYTWTYRVRNGEATIVAAGKARRCTISPRPKGHVVIPMKLGGVNVTTIGVESFCECAEMTSVEIPETVTEICWRAFSECGGLSSVMIPAGVKTIRPSAFSACNQLKAFSVNTENENYASQGGVLFDKGIKKLICYPGGLQGSYEVPSGVTEIEGNAFSGCKGLTSVIVADSVTRMGEFVFSQSRNLTSVILGSGVRWMGQAPFYWCSGLTSITVNESNEAYASRDGVLFDKGMKLLVCCPGGYAGDYVIPEGVRTIGRYAFDSCNKLTGVTIPSGVEVIDYHAFNYCQGLSVVIPSSVKKIGDWAFCRALKEVTLSEGLTSIGTGAFHCCREMTAIKIPSSVESIGEYAFGSCEELASVTMLGEMPKTKGKLFDRCKKLSAINVPSGAKSWNGMTTWQEMPLAIEN